MEEDNDFFGDVFSEPENDPLLGEDASEDAPTPDPGDQSGPDHGGPSWDSEDHSPERAPDESDPGSSHAAQQPPPEQKEIVVDQGGDDGQDLEELNEAVGKGWRLVHITLARDEEQDGGRPEAERIVAVLEQESPQSLFDFGAGG